MMPDDLRRMFEERLAAQGTPLKHHTSDCDAWKLEHENCLGCSYELGCSKYVAAQLIAMRPSVDEFPYDFESLHQMYDKVASDIGRVMNAKSVEEVKAVDRE